MIKGIVFDMDGLMFDTERLSVRAWSFAGAQAGYRITEELVARTIGLDLSISRRIFKECLGEELDFDALRKIKIGYSKDAIEKYGMPLKPGLRELLRYLKNNGYKAAVASSTEAARVAYYFEKAGITGFFDGVVCGDAVQNGKPAPDIYLRAGELLGLPPAECLALEDSPAGIVSAHGAGMKPVFIPDLVASDETAEKIAFAKLGSLFDVISLLDRLSRGDSE